MTNDETAMTELRELVKSAIMGAWESYDIIDDMDAITAAVLAIPRIKAGLEALERDEAMARKLGHSIGARP